MTAQVLLSPNYVPGRKTYVPQAIVIHTMGATLAAAEAVYIKRTSGQSVHYGIGRTGELRQYVREGDTALHAGRVSNPVWNGLRKATDGKSYINPNLYTIGIAFEGTSAVDFTDFQYKTGRGLIAALCRKWKIPVDKEHIVGYNEIFAGSNSPGPKVDVTKLMGVGVNKPAVAQPVAPTPPPPAAPMILPSVQPDWWWLTATGIPELWKQTLGEGVKVAVIDSGLSSAHPAFSGRTTISWYNALTGSTNAVDCADDSGHGTACAGMLAAAGSGCPGVAPGVDLLVIRAVQQNDMQYPDLVKSINYAVQQKADIISVSYSLMGYPPDQLKLLSDAVAGAAQNNVLVVASTGNGGDSLLPADFYPASCAECLAVGASNAASLLWNLTTMSTNIDVLAPGDAVLVHKPDGTMAATSGTSYATPFAAGVLALLLAVVRKKNPAVRVSDVARVLTSTTTNRAAISQQLAAMYTGNPELAGLPLGVIAPVNALNEISSNQ